MINGKWVLRAGKEDVEFKLLEAMKRSLDHDDACYSIDTTNIIMSDHMQEILYRV